MRLASWLLLQRAVNEDEISRENARSEKEKAKFRRSRRNVAARVMTSCRRGYAPISIRAIGCLIA
ncbi:MAG: DUF1465 family protein [Candidatus Devosia euplotis]|nr:DUF1465 family protein [Candidatus Devosia euplotis]